MRKDLHPPFNSDAPSPSYALPAGRYRGLGVCSVAAAVMLGAWLVLRRNRVRLPMRSSPAETGTAATAGPTGYTPESSASTHKVHLDHESVAGEEDPGVALDLMQTPPGPPPASERPLVEPDLPAGDPVRK